MSFFRNIRTSITRGKSSSRDTTPVRTGSIVSRRDSMESRTDSLFNRSDTFILGGSSDPETEKDHSNTSTLEKKSKKSKVLSKFSTFTKRKKTPSPEHETFEHHPSDNATNTYYKWKSEGPSTLDYDSQSDPFNFLYEQPSSLKTLQNGGNSATCDSPGGRVFDSRSSSSSSASPSASFDSSTYRKGKMPTYLKEQLVQLKTHSKPDLAEETETEHEADKFKTITLNSFRKSFREKFLQQQNDVPHNPAWFVEVEQPKPPETDRSRRDLKENRPDFIVFKNENYRPQSRSPVRTSTERPSRATTRSPVKRNETFRLERPTIAPLTPSTTSETAASSTPSIRIEIKNSIAPNMPGRIVPVGVAKPMPSQYPPEYYQIPSGATHKVSPSASVNARNYDSNKREKSPVRSWSKIGSVSPSRLSYPSNPPSSSAIANRSGRYQTLVQIRNEANAKGTPSSQHHEVHQSSPLSGRRRLSTRVQLRGMSPSTQKMVNNATFRYSLDDAADKNASCTPHTLSNYEPLKSSLAGRCEKPLQYGKHTYFGDSPQMQLQYPHQHYPTATKSRLLSPTTRALGGYNGQPTPRLSSVGTAYCAPVRKFNQQQSQTRLSSSGSGNYNSSSSYSNRRDQQQQHTSQQQQHQHRLVVPVQRRSRSPIKMPWR